MAVSEKQLKAWAAQSGLEIEYGPKAVLPGSGEPPAADSLEETFKHQVIRHAQGQGWRVAHFRPARVMIDGEWTYRTAVEADGAGWPDLVMLRREPDGRVRMVVAELKSERGTVRPDQEVWLELFRGSAAETFVWRPKDWAEVQNVLA